MARFGLGLALFAVALAAVSAADYTGYTVYRVVPRTPLQLSALHSFDSGKVDFWSKTRAISKPADVMVAPDTKSIFESFLRIVGIKYSVLIPNVQDTIDAERADAKMQPRLEKGRISFTQYHRYGAITEYIDQLASMYPSIVAREPIGKTSENRDLYMVKISATTTANPPSIVVDCGIHAREWIAPAMCLYIIQELVENLDNREMIQKVDWYIVPVLNPDGYEFSHTNERFWRKTRREPGTTNCYGVDANRNFPFHWMETGASSNECAETYAGPEEGSEPETQALMNRVRAIPNPQLYLTFHSYGQYLLYPWGWTSALPENVADLDKLAVQAEAAIASVAGTHYEIGSSTNVLYAAAGGSDDWMLGVGGIQLSYTIELPGGGLMGFDLPASRIDAVVKETWEGVRVYWAHINDNFAPPK